LGIVAAEQVPERQVGATRLEVPQRHVESRDGEHRRPAAAAVVQRPPGLEPQPLDVVGLLAGHDLRQFSGEHRVDGGAVAPDRVGVADALGAVGVPHPHGIELERRHFAVHRVAQDDRQRDP
jgi:hypothetical protein